MRIGVLFSKHLVEVKRKVTIAQIKGRSSRRASDNINRPLEAVPREYLCSPSSVKNIYEQKVKEQFKMQTVFITVSQVELCFPWDKSFWSHIQIVFSGEHKGFPLICKILLEF